MESSRSWKSNMSPWAVWVVFEQSFPPLKGRVDSPIGRSTPSHDSALCTARDDGAVVATDEIPHLVRDRSPCRRFDGRAWHHPEGCRAYDLGKGPQRHF